MTKIEPAEGIAREWIMVGIVLLGFMGDVAFKYFSESSSSQITANKVTLISDQVANLDRQMTDLTKSMTGAQITASQVATLATTVSDLSRSMGILSDKIGQMARTPDDIRAISSRLDGQAGQITDLQRQTSALVSVMQTIQPKFRNTP